MLALPLFMVACEPDTPVDEVKNPTVEITAGEATENSLSFTVSSTEATNVAWICIEATEEVPAAAAILKAGNAVEANKEVPCLANALEDNTEYTIVAVAKNSAGAVTKEIKMTTKELDPEATAIKLKSEGTMTFKAEGGKGTIEYEVINPVAGGKFSHKCEATWVKEIKTNETSATFTVEANNGDARETIITILYEEAKTQVKVKQDGVKGGNDDGEDDGNDDGEDDGNDDGEDDGKDDGKEDDDSDATDADVNFTASLINIEYLDMVEDSVAYNYCIILSDTPLSSQGMPNPSVDGTYYMLDLYATDQATEESGVVPNGTYKLNDNLAAGTFSSGDFGWARTFKGGEDTLYLYAEGTVVVSDGKIVADITMEDGSKHHVVYKGDLSWGNGGGDGGGPSLPDVFEATHTATKWFSGGQDSYYGFKYAVAGEDFSLNVFFPTKFISENALAAGEYNWTSTSTFGYPGYEDDFTTKTLVVDGTSVAVDAGKALVEVEGDVYHIELTLLGRDYNVYMIQFDGKFNDAGTDDGETAEEVVFTKMDLVEYISTGIYKYKLYNDNDDYMLLFVNDYQGKAAYINSDDTYKWIGSRGMANNRGYFATDYVKIGGESFTPTAGSMTVLTDDVTYRMSISITLLDSFQKEQVFTFNGKIGGEKLAAPVVTVEYTSGTTANVSWTAVEGAKDYTLKINGGNENTTAGTTATLNDLAYGTTYTVSVVANPADSDVKASDAGTATFTTEADPNAGGDDSGDGDGGNTGGVSYENWVFTASLNSGANTVTVTDGTHTVVFTINQVSAGTFYIYDAGTLNITKVVVDGVDTTDASGTITLDPSSFHAIIDATINGVRYTGTSTNSVV